jgi:hypothetical protein
MRRDICQLAVAAFIRPFSVTALELDLAGKIKYVPSLIINQSLDQITMQLEIGNTSPTELPYTY